MVGYTELYFKFNKNKDVITKNLHDKVNGFIQNIVNKERHDGFSEYSVSQLQGGYFDGKNIQYPKGAVLVFRTHNNEILNRVLTNCRTYKQEDLRIHDMPLIEISQKFITLKEGDELLIQRLALKDKMKDILITCNDYDNKDEYIDLLTEHCKSKLKHYVETSELTEEQVSSILIKPFKSEYWKTSQVSFHQESQSFPTSNIKITLEGDIDAKMILIQNGFGISTGYGCGSVKIGKNTVNNIKNLLNY